MSEDEEDEGESKPPLAVFESPRLPQADSTSPHSHYHHQTLHQSPSTMPFPNPSTLCKNQLATKNLQKPRKETGRER
jgi:hypothetical protein